MNDFSFHEKQLDNGYVEYIDHMGDDNASLVSARLSTGNATGVDVAKDDSLRDRLWKDQHTSPFESQVVKLNLMLPIFCLRQIERHRTLNMLDGYSIESVDELVRKFMNRNEFSGRYAIMPDLFYTPGIDRIMGKDPNNKQSSMGLLPLEIREEAVSRIRETNRLASVNYKWMCENGVANEVARFVLPGTQYTKIQLSGELLNWFKLLNLRMRPDVQLETRGYCEGIGRLVQLLYPKSWEVFIEHTYNAVTLGATERRILRKLLMSLAETPEDLKGVFAKIAAGAGDTTLSPTRTTQLVQKLLVDV